MNNSYLQAALNFNKAVIAEKEEYVQYLTDRIKDLYTMCDKDKPETVEIFKEMNKLRTKRSEIKDFIKNLSKTQKFLKMELKGHKFFRDYLPPSVHLKFKGFEKKSLYTVDDLFKIYPEIKDRFMKNYHSYNPTDHYDIANYEAHYLSEIIGTFFVWNETPEGIDFWQDIKYQLNVKGL